MATTKRMRPTLRKLCNPRSGFERLDIPKNSSQEPSDRLFLPNSSHLDPGTLGFSRYPVSVAVRPDGREVLLVFFVLLEMVDEVRQRHDTPNRNLELRLELSHGRDLG